MMSSDIQAIADELADSLQRPVAINDFALDLIAASAQEGEVDRYRVDSIVRRHTPRQVLALLQQRGLLHRREPFLLEAGALPGLLARMCIPVVDDGFPVAYIWIVIGTDGSLSPPEYQRVNRASQAVLQALRPGRTSNQEELMADTRKLQQVLDKDEYAAGFALSSLVEQGVLSERSAASVTVFELAPRGQYGRTDLRDTISQIHEKGRRSWANAALTGMIDGQLVLLTSTRIAEQRVREAYREMDRILETSDVEVRASGTSQADDWTRGLRKAYDEAAFTARVSARVTGLPRSGQFSDLGAFAVLRETPITEDSVAMISPAAAALRSQGNNVNLWTVLTLLNNAGDISRTCAELTIHRTTLYYRLERCSGSLGDTLQIGWKRTALHFGLMLGQLVDSP